MKPPTHVQVGPHRYRVLADRHGLLAGSEKVGQCAPWRLTITFDADQPHTQAADTVLHELIHAALAVVKLDDDTEEAICLALAPALLDIVRQNPRLIEWIVNP